MEKNKICKLIVIFLLIFYIISCKKEAEMQVRYYPTVKLDSIKNILLYSAEVYATMVENGGDTIINVGFCWNTNPNPNLDNSNIFIYDTTNFYQIIGELNPNTVYYIKAFAYTTTDTSYSNELSITTWNGELSDYDGNKYKGVQIGNQGWMAENLKVEHYSDGTPISSWCPPNNKYWYGEGANYYSGFNADLDEDGDLDYRDGEIYVNRFGYLYTWYAAKNLYSSSCNGWIDKKVTINADDVCPTGWHLPAKEEWEELIAYIDNDAQVLKSDSLWYKNVGNNLYGFNALPGGGRDYTGDYDNLYAATGYHSSTPYNSTNKYNVNILARSDFISLGIGSKNGAIPVRCIKDK